MRSHFLSVHGCLIKHYFKEDDLVDLDAGLIKNHMVNSRNRSDVIQVLSSCVSTMKTCAWSFRPNYFVNLRRLGELKLKFLRIAVDVGNEWLKNAEAHVSRGPPFCFASDKNCSN